jgi:hypothetical protein
MEETFYDVERAIDFAFKEKIDLIPEPSDLTIPNRD